MKFPLQSTVTIGKYVATQQRKGERYPLVLMLEPTLACNIACIGCGKIREYESNRARLSVEECIDAGVQCPAPVVSICGGEPLVYKGIEEVAAGMIANNKTVELCTNALRLEQCLDWFEPSPRMTFVVHLDGMREIHDYVCDYPGLWDIAVDAIKTARARGFRVTTNTTIFKETEISDVIEMMRYLTDDVGIDGMLAAGAAGLDLVELVERLGPFGAGNAEPRFALANLRVLRADVVGAQHVRCILGDGAGSVRLKAIAFRCLDGDLGAALLRGQGSAFHVAGHLRADNWQGRAGIQLMIDDAAQSAG